MKSLSFARRRSWCGKYNELNRGRGNFCVTFKKFKCCIEAIAY